MGDEGTKEQRPLIERVKEALASSSDVNSIEALAREVANDRAQIERGWDRPTFLKEIDQLLAPRPGVDMAQDGPRQALVWSFLHKAGQQLEQQSADNARVREIVGELARNIAPDLLKDQINEIVRKIRVPLALSAARGGPAWSDDIANYDVEQVMNSLWPEGSLNPEERKKARKELAPVVCGWARTELTGKDSMAPETSIEAKLKELRQRYRSVHDDLVSDRRGDLLQGREWTDAVEQFERADELLRRAKHKSLKVETRRTGDIGPRFVKISEAIENARRGLENFERKL
jgi:hypothetical protein